LFVFYYTILSVPKSFQTAPEGKPADDVGIFTIDRLFTNVVHILFAVMQEPTIIAQLQLAVELFLPPKIDVWLPDAVLQKPLLTVE
jgi:hypothetical protein